MKKRQEPEKPYFEIDENGKVKALPMKLPEILYPNNSAESKRDARTRRDTNFVLERMIMTPADFDDSPVRPAKCKKIERNARKALFKAPAPQKKILTRSQQPYLRPTTANLPSSLIPIGECGISTKNSVLNGNVLTSNLKGFCENLVKTEQTISKDEDEEFLKIEKNFEMNQSPLSAVCNLLENAKLDSPKKTVSEIEREIVKIVEDDQKDLEAYNLKHQKNMERIVELTKKLNEVSNLKASPAAGKENQRKTRRSDRIARNSPNMPNSEDLRKSTLKRSLSMKLQTNEKSPGIRRAVEMYNSLRVDHSILCTPKIDRTILYSPKAKSNLSRKLQQQCLLLQDTPMKK